MPRQEAMNAVGIMSPMQKWTAIKMGCEMFVTDADLNWMGEHLPEPDATRFHMDLASTHHRDGYQARLTDIDSA